MNTSQLWGILFILGLLTFTLRLVMIVSAERLVLPLTIRQALRFVPIAVLVALIVPDLFIFQGDFNLTPSNTRLIAGFVATLVAWFTRHILLTIASGMAALLVLEQLTGW